MVFQEAYKLTVLDRRTFATPLENSWGRVVNMANTCETFGITPQTVAKLIQKGYSSVALLAFMRLNDHPDLFEPMTNYERKSVHKCIKVVAIIDLVVFQTSNDAC